MNAHVLYIVTFTPAEWAAASLRRIIAHARPGLVRRWTSTSAKPRMATTEGEPEVGGIGLGEARPRRVADGAAAAAAGEPGATFGETDGVDHDEEGAGAHQRDERQVQPPKPERRQPDDRADGGRDDATDDDVGGHWQARIVQPEPQRDPRPDAQQGEVGERDEAQPAVQEADAERRQRVHRPPR